METDWAALVFLQQKFGNLSNESLTLITSLSEIVRTNTKTAFAHDRVLQRFFLTQGLKEAHDLPLVPTLKSLEAGKPLPTYRDYLEQYDVSRKPI